MASKLEWFWIYWDCASQTEVTRASPDLSDDEITALEDALGGGQYCWYPCPKHYHIRRVHPRSSKHVTPVVKQVIEYEED